LSPNTKEANAGSTSLEFVAIARALNADPLKLMADFVTDGKNKSARPKKPSAKRNS
jgi:hypothetical protein